MVEIFFRVLKAGCRVEDRRFEELERLLPCLIVAWRVLYLGRLGRNCPEISCEAVFEPAEWQSLYVVVKREPPPKAAPKLQEMIPLVAQLVWIREPQARRRAGTADLVAGPPAVA